MEARKVEEEEPTKLPISETLKVHESCKGAGDRETFKAFTSSSENLNLAVSSLKDEDVPVKDEKTVPDRASPVVIPVAADSVTIVREKPARSTSSRQTKKSRSLSRSRETTGKEAGAESALPERSESASGLFQYEPVPLIVAAADRPPVPGYIAQPLQLTRPAGLAVRERDVEVEGKVERKPVQPKSPATEAAERAAEAAMREGAPAVNLTSLIEPLRFDEISRDVPEFGHGADDGSIPEEMSDEAEDPDTASSLVHKLRLRNAKLEGKMEVLSRESDITLRERAELASQVSSLRSQIKEVSSSRVMEANQLETIREELRSARDETQTLDGDLKRTQLALDAKVLEAKGLLDEVQLNRKQNEEMIFRVKELEGSMEAKESTIVSLKGKVAELYMQVENTRQTAKQLESDHSSLKAELNSIQRSKQWYSEQLQATQEARNRLQAETGKLQTLLSENSKATDGLNFTNSALRMELSSMEQKMVAEKRNLACQLEKIRGDMIEREAIFEQIQLERSALEEAFSHKMNQLNEERTRADALQKKIEEVNQEMSTLQRQIDQQTDQLKEVEEEKITITKQQSFLQECVSQKERLIEDHCGRYNELADKLRKLDDRCRERDETVEAMTQERSSLEVMLASSRKEKDALDRHILTLKGDMVKVEDSFKNLRSELGSKAAELSHIRSMRDDIVHELGETRSELEAKEEAIKVLSKEHQDTCKAFSALQSENEGLREDLQCLRGKLEAAELRVAELERELAQTVEERNGLNESLATARNDIQSLKSNVHDLRVEVEVLREEHAKYMDLLQTHETVKAQLKSLADEHHQLSILYSTETTNLKAQIDNEKTERDRLSRENEESLRVMNDQLEELNSVKEGLEGKISMLVDQYEVKLETQGNDYSQQINALSSDYSQVAEVKMKLEESLQETKQHLETLTHDYNEQMMSCKSEIVSLSEKAKLCSTYEGRNKDLSLELERTRGKIDALLQTTSQLKQHVNVLEVALAKREGSLVEMASQSDSCVRRTEAEKAGVLNRLAEVEKRSQLDEELRSELSEQLNYHKVLGQKLRLENEQIKRDTDDLRDQLSDKTTSVQQLGEQVDALEAKRSEDIATLERLTAEKAELEHQISILRSHNDDSLQTTQDLQREIENLGLQLSCKSQEIEDLTKRLDDSNANHQLELERMKDIVEGVNRELSIAKDELETVRKEKMDFQSRLAHLRGALRAAIQRYRLFSEAGEDGHAELDLSQLEKLLEDSTPVQPSKPLLGLTRCLEGLRSEINELQDQVTGHTKAITESEDEWKKFESQTASLRTTCDEAKQDLLQRSLED